jgi:hypothetical protein
MSVGDRHGLFNVELHVVHVDPAAGKRPFQCARLPLETGRQGAVVDDDPPFTPSTRTQRFPGSGLNLPGDVFVAFPPGRSFKMAGSELDGASDI